jgi:hypothetical protein
LWLAIPNDGKELAVFRSVATARWARTASRARRRWGR